MKQFAWYYFVKRLSIIQNHDYTSVKKKFWKDIYQNVNSGLFQNSEISQFLNFSLKFCLLDFIYNEHILFSLKIFKKATLPSRGAKSESQTLQQRSEAPILRVCAHTHTRHKPPGVSAKRPRGQGTELPTSRLSFPVTPSYSLYPGACSHMSFPIRVCTHVYTPEGVEKTFYTIRRLVLKNLDTTFHLKAKGNRKGETSVFSSNIHFQNRNN